MKPGENVTPSTCGGFTVIALLLVLAALGLSWSFLMENLQNRAVSARVYEGEVTAATAMLAVEDFCHRNPPEIDASESGYQFARAPGSFIASLKISGACSKPLITIAMRHTGAIPDEPVLTYRGDWRDGALMWLCRQTADTARAYTPPGCEPGASLPDGDERLTPTPASGS